MARTSTLAHLSDLHFGSGARIEARTERLVAALAARDVDHVVVTGDVTHRGRADEYDAFLTMFSPWLETDRLTFVPGNHDRIGGGVGETMMLGERVIVTERPGLFLVQLDSTGPQNRLVWQGHGMITDADLHALDTALGQAPVGRLTVLLMHHHPYPLPEEGALELLSSWVGLPFAGELDTGDALLEVARGRCDLLLHGHRHVASARTSNRHPRPLRIYNAGSSPELGAVRIFEHQNGALLRREWIELGPAFSVPSWPVWPAWTTWG